MVCQFCNKNEASFKILQTIDNTKVELHLCETCAINNYQELIFDNFFKSFLDSFINPSNLSSDTFKNLPQKKCSKCGLTLSDIKKLGKTGCDNCYEEFNIDLSQIILKLQGNNRHEGKYPTRIDSEVLNQRRIEDLRKQLDICIKEEDYEKACKLRDEIKAIQGGSSNVV